MAQNQKSMPFPALAPGAKPQPGGMRLSAAEAKYKYNPNADKPWQNAIHDFEVKYIDNDKSDGAKRISLETAKKMAASIAGRLGLSVPSVEFGDTGDDVSYTDVSYDEDTGRADEVKITVSSGKPQVSYLLHEMAHMAAYWEVGAWCGHGPEFTARLLPLYAKYLNWNLISLLDSAAEEGLKFDREGALAFGRKIGCEIVEPAAALQHS
jgi:hypothetical protein